MALGASSIALCRRKNEEIQDIPKVITDLFNSLDAILNIEDYKTFSSDTNFGTKINEGYNKLKEASTGSFVENINSITGQITEFLDNQEKNNNG